MGTKSIWDGVDLPPIGCDVLVHLSGCDAYVRHKVAGFRISRLEECGWMIWVDLERSASDARSSKNCRFLEQCYPVDTDPLDLPVSGCLKTPRQQMLEEQVRP